MLYFLASNIQLQVRLKYLLCILPYFIIIVNGFCEFPVHFSNHPILLGF